ncbi:hypothetical protein Y032_0019g3917 [Ancylostoma ceylanicum]|uniref:Mos1 transposase HTH domain-containing protein n=1 Tax=Ancylostoma ceylanicum TaxID=53326 RepID=A0A016V2E0_9BILA|nr:hypothetical protein Y032_0019g3917 [Ancylostoma ceylanicum]
MRQDSGRISSRPVRCFDQNVVNERQWFHKFRSGNESLGDDASGRPPSVVDMEQLKEAIKEDPIQTTRGLAIRFGCSHQTSMRCLLAVGKSSRSGQWILHEQTDILSGKPNS